jgi:hypothetical protein
MMVLKIILVTILIVACWICYNIILKQIDIKKCRKAMVRVFPIEKITVPKLKTGTSYWYPTVEITFRNQQDFDYAKDNKLFEKYLAEIQLIYSGIKSFEAERAVTFNIMED